MGIAYFGLNELEKARRCFEQAMELKADEVKVAYNLAVVYEKLGFLKEAKGIFKEVSKMKPQTPEEEFWVEKARTKILKGN